MIFFRHPLFWLRAFRCGARLSSSAVIRGHGNIALAPNCRVGRQSELNASSGRLSIGEKATLGPFVVVEARGGEIRIGARTTVGPFCMLNGQGGLEIGNDCLIASHVVFIPENHVFDRSDVTIREQGGTRKGIRIGDDVWLATGAVVLDGVSIGQGAVIGAGAVVTRDVPAYAIAVGVPARVVGQRGGR